MQELGVNTSETNAGENLPPILAGKTIVVTGSLETFGRAEIEEVIRRYGGKASSSVSKKTDYLVVGAEPGTKLQKAEELGVKVLNEAEFKQLLEID